MKKQYLAMALAAVMTMGMAGCSQKPQESAAENGETGLKGDIEIVTNANEETFNAVNQVFQKFMEENPGVTINYTTQGADYEQLMKARMASNDLPDLFATHGWSVARYSEYLRPLTDQPWKDSIEESFLPNIENDNGEIFVLPINMDQGGLFYNKGLLKELGLEVPKTWEEFINACNMGKEKGYTGAFIAGKDSRQPANFMDIAATTYLISCGDKGYAEQLLDGTFDWENWAAVSQLLVDMEKNELFNTDSVTCDPIDIPQRLAENTTLFVLGSDQSLVQQVKDIDASVEFGMAPIPALDSSYEPAFCGGEREAYGIWKDTENEEVCFAILEYLSRPENVKSICEASGKLSAISGVELDLGSVAEDYASYSDVEIYPFFDRVYLPNGMWSTMKTIGSALLAGEMSVEESIQTMKTDYDTLRLQN